MPRTHETEPIRAKTSSCLSATAEAVARIPGLPTALKWGGAISAPAVAAGAIYLSHKADAHAVQTTEPAISSTLDIGQLDQGSADHWQGVGRSVNDLRASGHLNPITQIELTQVELSSNLSVDQARTALDRADGELDGQLNLTIEDGGSVDRAVQDALGVSPYESWPITVDLGLSDMNLVYPDQVVTAPVNDLAAQTLISKNVPVEVKVQVPVIAATTGSEAQPSGSLADAGSETGVSGATQSGSSEVTAAAVDQGSESVGAAGDECNGDDCLNPIPDVTPDITATEVATNEATIPHPINETPTPECVTDSCLTPIPDVTPDITATEVATNVAPTPHDTATATATPTKPENTATNTATAPAKATKTSTRTQTRTATATATRTDTPTPADTATATPTKPENTATNTATAPAKATKTPTPTNTPTATSTPFSEIITPAFRSPSPTLSPTATLTGTRTPEMPRKLPPTGFGYEQSQGDRNNTALGWLVGALLAAGAAGIAGFGALRLRSQRQRELFKFHGDEDEDEDELLVSQTEGREEEEESNSR